MDCCAQGEPISLRRGAAPGMFPNPADTGIPDTLLVLTALGLVLLSVKYFSIQPSKREENN